MAPRIFLTGGTGYVGGSVLYTLAQTHPEWEITVLLRRPPPTFNELYPNVKVVLGDYDSGETLSSAAAQADIVVHNGNSDHQPSLESIVKGLLQSEERKFLIHLSGTGVIADWRDPTFAGRLNPKVWSDVNDIGEITSRPPEELHRHTDKFLQDTARAHGDKLKIAIICPPDIYGKGHGPGRTQSVYIPGFYNEIKKIGAPFYARDGTNTRSFVHIDDLAQLYLKLVEAAVDGGGQADWGVEGYYFAASQEHSHLELAKATGVILQKHGILEKSDPKEVPLDQIDVMMSHRDFPDLRTYMFANSRSRAHRAAAKLGYSPHAPDLLETLESDLLACR
ncbi:Putative NAD-dependent epimerase/dehydratase, NAD(P)-binding domain-containing protein [Septoria linicola]|uniref:NAD-dependent epimerase/dehydratase, NAD(P)-binding domain-containing protein n=1 Tax=Septoria linicola TaxID=215465 RepID=A0A9Q9EMU4_9PEZI|nr:Putative NAD-dependent epimerase/dehydratase, NAD(P)-binding domain-containing protein [Septoria linicola]